MIRTYKDVKIKFTTIDQETGKPKKENGILLIDAETFGDAEKKAFDWSEANSCNDFEITGLVKSKITDYFPDYNGEFLHVCCVEHEEDRDNGKTKTVKEHGLIPADNARDAYDAAMNEYKEIHGSEVRVPIPAESKYFDVIEDLTDDKD